MYTFETAQQCFSINFKFTFLRFHVYFVVLTVPSLSYRLPSKNLKTDKHETGSYGCETLSFSLRREH
jgi:hypothetical protein